MYFAKSKERRKRTEEQKEGKREADLRNTSGTAVSTRRDTPSRASREREGKDLYLLRYEGK
jgi:hypothetical protein